VGVVNGFLRLGWPFFPDLVSGSVVLVSVTVGTCSSLASSPKAGPTSEAFIVQDASEASQKGRLPQMYLGFITLCYDVRA
jgi:hypothetical protein